MISKLHKIVLDSRSSGYLVGNDGLWLREIIGIPMTRDVARADKASN